jgi:hypothetical protein
MKLSEAMRMNGMMKPQGFGSPSIFSPDAPCALGGALQIIGRQIENDAVSCLGAVREAWPWSDSARFACPAGDTCCPDTGRNIVWHLNDQHRWTRQQIAGWVETVEPQEVAAVVPVVEEVLTHQ